MNTMWQLDGTCSANCCNSDGAIDEPCDQCKPTTGIVLIAPEEMPALEPKREAVVESAPKEPTVALAKEEPKAEVPKAEEPKAEEPKPTPKRTNYFGTS